MKRLNERFKVRNTIFENRIGFAPISTILRCDADGILPEVTTVIFREIAESGTGFIIQGSTSVCEVNRARERQAGIWKDAQIEGLSRITEVVHKSRSKILLQLQHAGVRSYVEHPLCAVDFAYQAENGMKCGRMATEKELGEIIVEFSQAAERAVQAGYDGIELHASHGWLLDSFLNRTLNTRKDRYGKDRTLFVREIYEAVRCVVPEDFIVGIRTGAFSPTLKDAEDNASALAEAGFDYLSISTNDNLWWLDMDYTAQQGYPFDPMIYAAGEIRKTVQIPVFAAKRICTAEDAEHVLRETSVDAVLIGRAMLKNHRLAEEMLKH